MEKSYKWIGKWSLKAEKCDWNCCRLKICKICDLNYGNQNYGNQIYCDPNLLALRYFVVTLTQLSYQNNASLGADD